MNLLADYNLPFAAALLLMLFLALAQAIGLGDMFGDADLDVDADVDGDASLPGGAIDGLVSFIGIGRVPLMVWLAVFLFAFAAFGIAIQHIADGLTGHPLDRWLAAILAAGVALPAAGVIARPLGRILPHDETTAVHIGTLLGRRATITDGIARAGSSARARVLDAHGMTHHIMVQPHENGTELHAGDAVLLVRREDNLFFAAALADRQLSSE